MQGAAQSEATISDRLHFASLEPVRIGMPELCRAGLSENWLLKACGHRHWLALAHAHGQDTADFRDIAGERLYPAFTSVRLDAGRLDTVREDDRIAFAVTLRRTARTRFRSEIAVTCAGRAVATICMESAFVRRAVAGRNQSAVRAVADRPCRLSPPALSAASPPRADVRRRPSRLEPAARGDVATLLIDPSPHEDFNGADFLYFAAFQAMLDRAEWHWFHRAEPLLVTAEREIAYYGNIELGDRVWATLCDVADQHDHLSHRIELSRASDGQMIASAISRRRPVRCGAAVHDFARSSTSGIFGRMTCNNEAEA